MSSYLNETGLAYLIGKIKTGFISTTDTTAATTVSIETSPTSNSSNLVTSGGVYTALSGKQDTIDSSHKLSADLISDGSTNKVFTSTLKTKLTGIAEGAEVNVQPDWNVTDTTSDAYIKHKPTNISEFTNDAGYITANGILDKADKSAAIGTLSLALDQSTYVITLSGTKVDGTAFTVNNTIDLPLESVVVGGNYNDTTKKVELTLKSGSTVEFSVADLIAGLQSEITTTNKLSGDLIEDGTVTKVVNVKSDWNVSDNTSYAYILNKPSIPVDNNLVHKTGNETIGGDKTFSDDITTEGDINATGIYSEFNEFGHVTIVQDGVMNTGDGILLLVSDSDNGDAQLIVGNAIGNPQAQTIEEQATGGWSQIYNAATDTTLQDELDARVNTKGDWSITDPSSPAYIQNTYIVTDELTYLHNAYDTFMAEYEDDNYVISTALTDLDSRVTLLSNSTFSGDYDDLTNKPTIPTLVKSDWNVTDNTSYAYILNKPTGQDYLDSINGLLNTVGDKFAIGSTTAGNGCTIMLGYDAPGNFINLQVNDGDNSITLDESDGIHIYDYTNDHLQYNDEDIAFLSEVPNNANLVHRSGAESISGLKSFTPQLLSQTYCYIGINESVITYSYATAPNASTWDWSWIGVRNPLVTKGSPIKTLQQELDARDNVQADWSTTNPSNSSYIHNKPDLSQYLTYHQSIKTINNQVITGTGNVNISGLPAVTAADNGKILMVIDGEWALVSPSVLYQGTGIPNNSQGNNGDLYTQTS